MTGVCGLAPRFENVTVEYRLSEVLKDRKGHSVTEPLKRNYTHETVILLIFRRPVSDYGQMTKEVATCKTFLFLAV